MPKVKAKSIGRKFKTSTTSQPPIPPAGSEETPSRSTENVVDEPTTTEFETEILDNSNVHEMEALGASTTRLYVHMGVRVCMADVIPSSTAAMQAGPSGLQAMHMVNVIPSSAAAMQPGPSGLQVMVFTSAIANTANNIPAEIVAEPFEVRLASLIKMERKTAQAFKQQNIEEEYEWPVVNESKDDAVMRKYRNTAKLAAARRRQFRNPADEELSQQRHQADAESRREFRTPEDEEPRRTRPEKNTSPPWSRRSEAF